MVNRVFQLKNFQECVQIEVFKEPGCTSTDSDIDYRIQAQESQPQNRNKQQIKTATIICRWEHGMSLSQSQHYVKGELQMSEIIVQPCTKVQ